MKKKILIVSEYFYPEEFKINEIAIEWQKKGYEVDILTNVPTYPAGKIFDGYENRWYQKDSYEGMNIFRVKAITGYKESIFKKLLKYFAFMFIGSFVALKIGKKYDYVFGFDIAALTSMTPAILLQKFYKKRVTIWVQDIWPDSVYAYGFKKTKVLSFFLNSFVKFIYRNSTNFAISGKGFLQKVELYLDEDKEIKYLPNWADDIEVTTTKFSFSDDKKVHFTFAGNVGSVQNLENVINAFALLDESLLMKAQLNIIGDGSYLDTLTELVENKGIKNVVFWGRQPRNDMYKYFKASDFLIVSLIDKPIFSLTVTAKTQTYIAMEKPIIAILKGDAATIIDENKLGFSVSPDDLDAIKNIFVKSITLSKNERETLSKNAKKLTQTLFNKDKIIDDLLHLLVGEKK